MLEYFNLVGCFLYSLIILAILRSNDKSFRTPFWIFFISGGLYGIYCVLVFDFDWSWDAQSAIKFSSGHQHHLRAWAHNRQAVRGNQPIRSGYLTDNKWELTSIVALLVVQFLVPLLVCAPFAFVQPTGHGKEYGPNYLIDIVRITSAAFYGAYVIAGLVLTVLSMRRLRILLGIAKRSKKKQTIRTVRKEAVITIYSSLLFLAHSLKSVQQIIFVVFASRSDLYDDALALYPFINDVAVFSSPVLLLITSSQLRLLIRSYFRRPQWKRSSMNAMLVVQLLIPILVCVPFAFERPTGIGKEYGPNYLTDIVRIISAVLYGSYVIGGLVLTVLSMRKLHLLLGVAKSSSKPQHTVTAVRQEVVMTIYSSILYIAHSLKCVQQILFIVFARQPKLYADCLALVRRLCFSSIGNISLQYPYINDVAVFSSPVLLLITSSQLRHVIYSYFHRPEFVQISPLATVTRM
ncbi:hypothetical protein PRIPAC_97940 [Pristionchus pacificus]|uniref:Serpentine receptor class gamma n=1 Tax=Pristionchus pacificus TaxID=54126 RepID=A0A2A6B3A2_PRIPA|nr:hypothetical protein PRIPAC_97940 [Pristionchus pacificus]|eukprot:PDM60350.1 G protein-coupled receptor [Pristionchus pacificus]